MIPTHVGAYVFLSVFVFLRLAGRSFIEPCQMSVNKMKLGKTGCFVLHWHLGFTVDRGAKLVQTPGHGATEGGPGPECVAYVIVFLGSIRCYQAVIYYIDGICGQRPCCVRQCQLCFPYRSARAGGHVKIFCHWGPNPLSEVLL